MEDRTRAYVESLPGPARTLAAVNPAVVVLALHRCELRQRLQERRDPLRIGSLPSRARAPSPRPRRSWPRLSRFRVRKLRPRDAPSGVDQRPGEGVLGGGWVSRSSAIGGWPASRTSTTRARSAPTGSRARGRRAGRRRRAAERHRLADDRRARGARARPGQAGHLVEPGLALARPRPGRGPRVDQRVRPAPERRLSCSAGCDRRPRRSPRLLWTER